MIRDRALKSSVLRYVVSKRWFPQLEVDVFPRVPVDKVDRSITDIDVIALLPDEFEGFRTVLFDCTTRKGESPISRALWQRGLMEQVNAKRGICVLKHAKIEQDHRYAAAQLGVLLLTGTEFAQFARATGGRSLDTPPHSANIDLWDTYVSTSSRTPSLENVIRFAFSGHWMCQSDSEACRKTIAVAKDAKPELDPARPNHMAIVGDLGALFMLSVARIAASIFSAYLQPHDREQLSRALLYLLYGGREAYEYRNRIRKLVPPSNAKPDLFRQSGEVEDLTPPEWNRFLELVRGCLESPTEVSKAPLLIREVGFAALAQSRELSFAEKLAAESPHAARLSIFGIEYLCRASSLPAEFAKFYADNLLGIQRPPA